MEPEPLITQTGLTVLVAGALTALTVLVAIILLSDRGPKQKQD